MPGKVIDIDTDITHKYPREKTNSIIRRTFSFDDHDLIFYLDTGISLFDLKSCQIIKNEYLNSATSNDFFPDGETFVTGDYNGLIHVLSRELLEPTNSL